MGSPCSSMSSFCLLVFCLSALAPCLSVKGPGVRIPSFVPEELSRHQVNEAKINYARNGNIFRSTQDPEKPPEDPSDTVPIVVGCVLAGLIIVVFVSYFVVRSRRTTNYMWIKV